ncbi:hypothetical protein D3C75_1138780 [compost metagenome]
MPLSFLTMAPLAYWKLVFNRARYSMTMRSSAPAFTSPANGRSRLALPEVAVVVSRRNLLPDSS